MGWRKRQKGGGGKGGKEGEREEWRRKREVKGWREERSKEERGGKRMKGRMNKISKRGNLSEKAEWGRET